MPPVLRLLVTACLAATLATGCKPKAGAACKLEKTEVCVGDKQALACHEGKWEEMSCKGPAGCNKKDNVCDQSVADDKDVCNLEGDFLCQTDKKGMLECQRSRWTLAQTCLGERGCTMEAKKVTCDNSIANLGDACREEDDYACTADKKSALVCRQGKFVISSYCRGKNGCRVIGDKTAGFKVECQDDVAPIGDPCDKEGNYACTPDEKQIVKCVGKKYVADDRCKGKEKCGIRGDLVGCY